jgi:hypothetical protein
MTKDMDEIRKVVIMHKERSYTMNWKRLTAANMNIQKESKDFSAHPMQNIYKKQLQN